MWPLQEPRARVCEGSSAAEASAERRERIYGTAGGPLQPLYSQWIHGIVPLEVGAKHDEVEGRRGDDGCSHEQSATTPTRPLMDMDVEPPTSPGRWSRTLDRRQSFAGKEIAAGARRAISYAGIISGAYRRY